MTARVCPTILRSVFCRSIFCIGLLAVGLSHASAQSLPSPWSNRDIGATGVAGSASESNGSYTVRGAGNDIWYWTDQFHFVYQPISGDVDLRAQVVGLEYTHPWAKSGVMIRETLEPTSRHASTFVTPANGLAFQRRIATAGASSSTSGGAGAAPYWVRVVRAGQLFTSYVSADGATWRLVGSETIAMQPTVYVGLAVVSKDTSRAGMATFTNVTVNGSGTGGGTPPPPPPPTSAWSNGDVGGPALAGRASESSGTFSVTGAGSDIWGGADQFHYMYQRASGDAEIVARVASIEYAHSWSKAGVMIRETLTGGSAHAYMLASAGSGWAFQRRPSTGSPSVSSPGTFSAPPGWVRLVRSGHTFNAYESTNGTSWVLVGTETIPMAADVYIGLAVTSHNASTTSTATFTNVTIARPTAGNASPSVTLSAPANGSTFTAPATIGLSATAGDTDGSVTRVDFVANGQVVGSDTTAPYQASWSSVPQGTYNVTAVATDDDGAKTTSGTAAITVKAAGAANTPPTLEMTSPANRSTYTAPATIPIAADATDDGTVTRVEFFAGPTQIGTDTSAPFGMTWSNVAAGTYAISAAAYDNSGAVTWGSSVHVTVNAGSSNTPPTVSITSPANGATFTAPASITINANAADSNGTVSRVDFYAGGQFVGSDTTAGYSATWTNVPAGTYSLTAIARDNDGAATTSAAVSVTVNPAPPPPTTPPTTVVFNASSDHASGVTSYSAAVYRGGDNPSTATPAATKNIGKPTPSSANEISADITDIVNPLPAGTYFVVVTAIGPGGNTASAPSPNFTK